MPRRRGRRQDKDQQISERTVHLDLGRLGLGLRAHVSLRPRLRSVRNAQILRDRLLAMGHVLSCVHVTGENCYELTVAVRGAQHLEQVIEDLSEMGDTTTGVVLSGPVHPRDVDIAAWLLPED
ncbi:Lrp/AsnC ligand binding domain-containing protein [Streptomyces pristinaespiralis]|jgi:Lrp/AsnC family transcriptional regulator, leucine-responsive regulatory protein|uniref:Lrp/AsnC ligand binding domain-containing protein n=1 Tax=Streptomyces pristinaespiralis TaxID=38300 RepID=UPI003832E9DA